MPGKTGQRKFDKRKNWGSSLKAAPISSVPYEVIFGQTQNLKNRVERDF